MLYIITNYLTKLGLSTNDAITASIGIILLTLIIAAILIKFIFRYGVLYIISKAIAKTSLSLNQNLSNHHVFNRVSHTIAGSVIYFGSNILTSSKLSWTRYLIHFVQIIASIYILLAIALSIGAIIDSFYLHYRQSAKQNHYPIRSYLQVIKLFIWILTVILIASAALNKSPWAFLASLGAVSAVLVLVFKDTILGFIINIQASVYDIVRVGDWITIPQYGIDGDVIDISVNTVKVQNFDKTIVTIPIANIMNSGVKNWRGMSDAGGRRIKRSISINIDSIRFCDQELLENLKSLDHLKSYLNKIVDEIKQYNKKNEFSDNSIINGRQLTNIGLFRQYTKSYLLSHPNIQNPKDFTFIVRQLQPTSTGLPLELYVFTTETNWVRYEEIQADIFDHLLAALNKFDLKAFQVLASQNEVSIVK